MSPRSKAVSQSKFEEYRLNIARAQVIACSVANYENLPRLPGAMRDLEMVDDIFNAHADVAIYSGKTTTLLDPSVSEFRGEILKYSVSRSARADILIFYFSGHGTILGADEFEFCLKDTAVGITEEKALS